MRRSARKHKSSRRTKKTSSFYILLAILIIVLFLAGKTVVKNLQEANVLGKSIFLAQEFQPPPSGGSGSGGSTSNPPPAQEQPQQQSQSQPQPQQQSQPAPQQQSSPQQPQQQTSQQTWQQPAYQPQQNYNQQPQQYQQFNQTQQGQQYQQQYQQNQQRTGSSQQPYQQYQQPGQQGQYQQRTDSNQQQYQQPGQPGQQYQSGQPGQPQQPGQPSSQQGFYGQNAPTQEQYREFQQQFQKEAEKFGIQFSGNLPQQFQQYQIQQRGNTQNAPGQANQTGQQNTFNSNTFQPLPSLKDFPTITGRFEVQSTNRGQNINLNDVNTKVVLGNDMLKARDANGKEVELPSGELEKINQAMELSTGSKIEQAGKNFVMKRGGVEAQTNFPISFNVATKTFTVTTPNGEKEIAVLPDQAVQKVMQGKIISKIAQQGTGESKTPTVSLTELDSQPVFEVKGVSQEKFLGFVPVSISKTTFVSAENGNLVRTDVSIFNRLLDTISF